MPTPLEVFCCYAREDQEMFAQLKRHLMPLVRQDKITIWSDTNLNAGIEWEAELHKHLESADIILLLISPDFMASDYCYSTEMGRAIARHDEGYAVVVPILLRSTLWQNAPFAKLHIVPKDAKPVTNWPLRDDALLDITLQINRVVSELQTKRAQSKADNYNGEQPQSVAEQPEPASEIKHKAYQEPIHRSKLPQTETAIPRITRRKILTVGLVGISVVGIVGASVFEVLQEGAVRKDNGSSGTAASVATHAANTTPTTYLVGGPSDLTSITWSPDGKLIALGVDNTVHVLNAVTGKKVFETAPQLSRIFLVIWSPDGSKIASGCLSNQNGRVQVWNAHDGSQVTSMADEPAPLPWSFAWSPNSQNLVTSGGDSSLDLWDPTSADGSPGYQGAVVGSPVAWSPDGNVIACSGLTTLDIWNPDTSGLSQYNSGSQSYALAWSADGKYLAASSATTLEIWNTQNWKRLIQMKSGR